MATFSDAAWDGAASQWPSTEAYCSDCLIDLNPSGAKKTQAMCKLPVKRGGTVYKAAMHSAAAVLGGSRGGVDAPPQKKRAAARELLSLYRQAGETPPDSLVRLGRG